MTKVEMISLIVLIVIVLAFIGYIIYTIYKKGLRQTAIDFICLAEKYFEYGKNTDKFQYVYSRIYDCLPSIIKIFITKEILEKFIQEVFDEIKVALDINTNKGI